MSLWSYTSLWLGPTHSNGSVLHIVMVRPYTSLWLGPTRRYGSVLHVVMIRSSRIVVCSSHLLIIFWLSQALQSGAHVLCYCLVFVAFWLYLLPLCLSAFGAATNYGLVPLKYCLPLTCCGLVFTWLGPQELVFRHYIFGSRRLNGLVPSYYSMVLVHFGLVIMK